MDTDRIETAILAVIFCLVLVLAAILIFGFAALTYFFVTNLPA